MRVIGNASIAEWLLAAITVILCILALDSVRAYMAQRHGVAAAHRDLEARRYRFRVGGKPRAWDAETAKVFRDRYGAELVRSHAYRPTDLDRYYDTAYNDTMAAALARRIEGFSFRGAYRAADHKGRSMKTGFARP